MNDDRHCHEGKNRQKDNPCSHRRCSGLVFVELRELGRFTHKSFLANLFPQFMPMEKTYVRRNEKEGKEKRKKKIREKEGKISHGIGNRE